MRSLEKIQANLSRIEVKSERQLGGSKSMELFYAVRVQTDLLAEFYGPPLRRLASYSRLVVGGPCDVRMQTNFLTTVSTSHL